MKSCRHIFLALFLLTVGALAYGQEEDASYSQQAWFDLNPRWIIGPGKFTIAGTLGYRTIFSEDWNRYIANVGLRYTPFIQENEKNVALQHLQFRAGIGDYFTSTLDSLDLNEIRVYQGVRTRWPKFRRGYLTHYVRMEERFEHRQDSERVDFSLRFRYRLTAKIRLLRPALQDLYFPISAEVFLNSSDGLYFNDLTRVTPGIGYDFSDQFFTELHLSYHFSRNSSTASFENNDIVYRLRVYFVF